MRAYIASMLLVALLIAGPASVQKAGGVLRMYSTIFLRSPFGQGIVERPHFSG
jgi:hypothetical protein